MNEQDFDNVCVNLVSNLVTKRKKSHQDLSELLSNPYALKCLNSTHPRFHWDTIVSSVEQYLLKEAEKMQDEERKSKVTYEDNKQKAISKGRLLSEVISKANCDIQRISGTKLIRGVVNGFESALLRKYYADLYLEILVKFLLPVKRSWGDIDNKKCIDLFSLLKELYTKSTNINKFNVIKALWLICVNSDLKYPLLLYLRREFQFITTVCQDYFNVRLPHNQQQVCVKLALTFCEKLSYDCRFAVCKLGEQLINPIIDLRQSRYDRSSEIHTLIFKFVLLQVRLHHPKGKKKNDCCAYSVNWELWLQQLKNLYSLICKEIHEITKHKNNDSKQNLCPVFLQLTTEVFNQVFYENLQKDIEITLNESLPNKRMKTDIGIAFMLRELQIQNPWPWLEIFCGLFTTYPDFIEASDYASLLQILASKQSECKDNNTRYHLYELLTIMSDAERNYSEDFIDINIISSHWSMVWETSVRFLGLHQDDESVHKLIRSLLKNKRTQTTAVFNLYMTKVLNNTTLNIQTLNVLFQNYPIPENISNGNETIPCRKFLIRWILDLNDRNKSDAFAEKITAEVLLNLILKNWLNVEIKYEKRDRTYEDIEDICILTSLENDEQSSDIKENIDSYLTHSDSYSELLETLQNFVTSLFESDINDTDELVTFINFITLLLNVSSLMLDFEIINQENVENLIDFERLYQVLTTKITSYLQNRPNNCLLILTKIEYIFSLNLNKVLSKMLRNNGTVDFLTIFFKYIEENGSSENTNEDFDSDGEENVINIDVINTDSRNVTENIFSKTSLTSKEKELVACMSIISKFISFTDSNSFNEIQLDAAKSIIQQLNQFDMYKNVDIQMIVHVLNDLISTKPGTLNNELLTYISKAIRNILISWQTNNEVVCYLIDIIKRCLIHFHGTNVNVKNNFLKLLQPIRENIQNYSVDVNIAFLNCLGHLAEVDPLNEFENSQLYTLQITDYLNSDFIQFRLLAKKNILKIFRIDLGGQTMVTKQQEFFHHFCCNIMKSFTVGDDLSEELKLDESVNRTATALQSFAALIVSSPTYRKRSIFGLIQLYYERSLPIHLVKKVLNMVCRQLHMTDIEELFYMNTNYIMSHWTKLGYKLLDFPFEIMGCENRSVFLNQYLGAIVPILLEDNTDLLEEICKETNKSVSDVMQVRYIKKNINPF